jgi:pimeloyl-ACP methyl ester carboxylesterase
MKTVGIAISQVGNGYWLALSDGGIVTFGTAASFGSMAGQPLNKPVVGIAATSSGLGYWLTAGDGGVFAFGDAGFFGSMGGQPLNKPVVGIAATPSGNGYWLTASDGGVFTFGDAGFFGSLGSQPLNKPVVGIAATLSGNGYWLTAGDGGVFTFGDAGFFGSMGSQPLNKPVVGIAATPGGQGYWLAAGDGGVFAFGDAGFFGSLGSQPLTKPVVGIAATPSGKGYWLIADDGRVFAFGDAGFSSLVITDPIQPPTEPCENRVMEVTGSFDAPSTLIDCTDPHCGRLIQNLRRLAKTKMAKDILIDAACVHYMLRRPEVAGQYALLPTSFEFAQALADLAVTGQGAYTDFRQLALSEADLIGPVTDRLKEIVPLHEPILTDVSEAVEQTLQRSYQVAWALRGPTEHRRTQRASLGWIAVEGEDDSPHRPVNVPSALYPQYNMTVDVVTTPAVTTPTGTTPPVKTQVVTRYIVASRHITEKYPVAAAAIPPDPIDTVPPDPDPPLIVGDIILFIHGHSSSSEEAMPLVGPLLKQAGDKQRPVTVIAMDLPSNGYASMIKHEDIAPPEKSLWNVSYPILDFIENFIVAFVEALEDQQLGIKKQIIGVIGGSLGGNMTLRLGKRDPASHPWLHSVVSWSPACAWLSWARAVLGPATAGRFYDFVKHEGVGRTQGAMVEAEVESPPFSSLNKFFYQQFAGRGVGRVAQSDHWFSPNWPCREAARTGSHRSVYEIYNPTFRQWHWRVAHEQLIYSHWDSDNKDLAVDPDPRNNPTAGPARYAQIKSRLLLATGHDDDNPPEMIFLETSALANAMTMVNGTTLFLKGTGHAITTERPIFFAGQILEFLFMNPPKPAVQSTVWIREINFNPPGPDVDFEYVVIQNDTAAAISMGNWTLRDVANHVFTFPSFVLQAGLSVKIWTTAGTNDAENLFWGRRAAVWNNTRDTGILSDQDGKEIARYAY